MKRALDGLDIPPPGGGDSGGGDTGGGDTHDPDYTGPWKIKASDKILPDAIAAASLILAAGDLHHIFTGDPRHITFQSTNRPAKAPSWAWADTFGNPPQCWINPAVGNVDQRYSIPHEWFHTIDDRWFTPAIRTKVRQRMGTNLTWNEGHYDAHYSTIPGEGAADAFARAITGGGFTHVLPGFYRTTIKPKDYDWFLTLVAEAMHA
jgi:hypothetical protein